MTTMTTVDSATLASQNIGAGSVSVFSKTLAGTDSISAIAAIRLTGRGAATTVDIRVRVLCGGLLLADNTIEYLATATASIEIQTLPFVWRGGEVLQIFIQSSSTLDNAVGIATVVSTEASAATVDTAAIATAVVEKVVTGSEGAGAVGTILHAINTMIEFVGSVWRWKAKALEETPKDPMVEEIRDIVENLGYTEGSKVIRAVDDFTPIHFVFPVENATLTGTKSVNGGSSTPIEGTIAAVDIGLAGYWYLLDYDAQDRTVMPDDFIVYNITDGSTDMTILLIMTESLETKEEADERQTELLEAIDDIPTPVILPVLGRVPERGTATNLKVFYGETIQQRLFVYESDGTTPKDLSGLTLEFIVERNSGEDVDVISGGSLTIAGEFNNQIEFNYTKPITTLLGTRNWALRDASDPETVYLYGTLQIAKAARNANNS